MKWELFRNGKRTGIIESCKVTAQGFIDHMVKLRASRGEPEVRYTLKEIP